MKEFTLTAKITTNNSAPSSACWMVEDTVKDLLIHTDEVCAFQVEISDFKWTPEVGDYVEYRQGGSHPLHGLRGTIEQVYDSKAVAGYRVKLDCGHKVITDLEFILLPSSLSEEREPEDVEVSSFDPKAWIVDRVRNASSHSLREDYLLDAHIIVTPNGEQVTIREAMRNEILARLCEDAVLQDEVKLSASSLTEQDKAVLRLIRDELRGYLKETT